MTPPDDLDDPYPEETAADAEARWDDIVRAMEDGLSTGDD